MMVCAVIELLPLRIPATATYCPTVRSAVVPGVGGVVLEANTLIVVEAVIVTVTERDCASYSTVILVPLFAVIAPKTPLSWPWPGPP